jgi:hypothetical protein
VKQVFRDLVRAGGIPTPLGSVRRRKSIYERSEVRLEPATELPRTVYVDLLSYVGRSALAEVEHLEMQTLTHQAADLLGQLGRLELIHEVLRVEVPAVGVVRQEVVQISRVHGERHEVRVPV